jgi:hypothetical protein
VRLGLGADVGIVGDGWCLVGDGGWWGMSCGACWLACPSSSSGLGAVNCYWVESAMLYAV